jgi:NAD(P)-dependent dehydrogenase (short-subunit alcohol dehydrogenase family)
VPEGRRTCTCRASKAALNQLTKTMSLEFQRRRRKVACVLLHPGTCDTDLSQPFQKNVPNEKLFSRERGAQQLLSVVDSVTMDKNGAYLAWDGSTIPW